jgi:hypothetical protein
VAVSGGVFSRDVSLAQGVHNVRAIQTDPAGNASVASTALVVTVDTTAPGAPTVAIDLAAASDTGSSTTDNITNDTTPTVRVSLTGTSAVAGDIVELLLGGSSLGTPVTVTLGAGDITSGFVDVTVTDGDLGSDGSKTLTARVTDVAGNVGAAGGSFSFTLDTTAPVVDFQAASLSTNASGVSTLTLFGTGFSSILGTGETAATDIKGRVDLTDLDLKYNSAASTANIDAGSVASVTIASGNMMVITSTGGGFTGAGVSSFANPGFDGRQIAVATTFVTDLAGNALSAGDTVQSATISIETRELDVDLSTLTGANSTAITLLTGDVVTVSGPSAAAVLLTAGASTTIANGSKSLTLTGFNASTTALDGSQVQFADGSMLKTVVTDGTAASGGAGADQLVVYGATAATLRGNSGNDVLTGADANDFLYGGNGVDTLRGNGGDDYLSGGAGLDTLIGGTGNDVLIGGSGNDVFQFAGATDFGVDLILDFAVGDTIQLGVAPGTATVAANAAGYVSITFVTNPGDEIRVLGASLTDVNAALLQ